MIRFHPLLADRRGPKRAIMRGLQVAGCALMLSGCYGAHDTTDSIPVAYRARHPITVKESDHTVEVFIGASRGGLTPFQRADVLAFAQAWKREATGGILIDLPSGTANEIAAADAAREIRSILAAAEIPLYAINTRSYQPENRNAVATVKLNYAKITAEAGPCGLWPADLGPTYHASYNDNKPYWNFGCATQRNLAAMAENPADLVQPRGETPAYTARRTVVLDKYRKGEPTGAVSTNSDQGKIGNVGK
jgi:pilus assembly protein CpaD